MNPTWLHCYDGCPGIDANMSRLASSDPPQPTPVMVGFTVAHVATGTLALASRIIVGIQVFRHVQRPLTHLQHQGVAVPSA